MKCPNCDSWFELVSVRSDSVAKHRTYRCKANHEFKTRETVIEAEYINSRDWTPEPGESYREKADS